MKSESEIQTEIQTEVCKHDAIIFRTNVGTVRTTDGRFFKTGLPKGHPDLYGFKKNNGKIFYIEVKDHKGRPRKEQVRFHEMLTRNGIIHGIARSPEDAVKIVTEELVGYGF
ncbi:VRR-NUC domain-containing protein [Holzapfeliella sp. JNUCC 80]